MKAVDNSIPIKHTATESGARANPASTGPGPGGVAARANSGAESVTLTRTAAELLKLEQQLAELPAINESRVAAIRQAIEDGSYQIDTDKLVDNLIRAEQDRG